MYWGIPCKMFSIYLLLIPILLAQFVKTSGLLELFELKYPGLSDYLSSNSNDIEFRGPTFTINNLNKPSFSDFFQDLETDSSSKAFLNFADNYDTLINMFVPDYSSDDLSREIFDYIEQIGSCEKFITAIAANCIILDVEELFNHILEGYAPIIQRSLYFHSNKVVPFIPKAIASAQGHFKYAKKLLESEIDLCNIPFYVVEACTKLTSSKCLLEKKEFIKYLIEEKRLWEPNSILIKNECFMLHTVLLDQSSSTENKTEFADFLINLGANVDYPEFLDGKTAREIADSMGISLK